MKKAEVEVAQALKFIARNQAVKSYIQQSNELYSLLLKAAKRFVTGEIREDGMKIAKKLISKGYLISLEYIGENTTDLEKCVQAKNEFLELIEAVGIQFKHQTISLDLSHIGLSVHQDLAQRHLWELASKANQYGVTLMVSMEESAKTDAILDIYKNTSKQYSNIGITIQAHLYRSGGDLQNLLHYPGRIRVVKGAYQESADMAMPRSQELNNTYLQFVEQLLTKNHQVYVATHDEILIQEMEQRGLLTHPNVEIEMLYGVRPDLLKYLKSSGYSCKIYLTYGQEWYLYLCHRIAEYPESLFQAVTDMITPSVTGTENY